MGIIYYYIYIYLFLIFYFSFDVQKYNIVKYTIFPVIAITFFMMLRKGKFYFGKSIRFFGVFLIFPIYVFVAAIFNSYATFSLAFSVFSNIIVAYFISLYMKHDMQVTKFLFPIYAACMILVFNFFRQSGSLFWGGYLYDVNNDVNLNFRAHIYLLAFIINFILLLRARKLKSLYILTLLMTAISITVTASRQAFVMILLFILIYVILRNGRNINLMKISVYLILAILFMYVLFTYLPNNPLVAKAVNSEDDSRILLAQKALDMFYEKPMFGYGFGTFSYFSGTSYAYSHNMYTELLFGGGIWGFVFCLLPYVLLMADMLSKIYLKPFRKSKALPLFGALLFVFFAEGMFFMIYNSIFFYLMFFIIYRYVEIERK